MHDVIYSAGYFVLELDGTLSGVLKEFEGGGVNAAVIEDLTAPGPYVKKHIGRPNYEDLVLELGFSMSRELYDWIEASWARKDVRKSGAIALCDPNMDARTRHVFKDAVIAETTLPACDASSSDPAYLTLRLAPEYAHAEKASGRVALFQSGRQKTWLRSNFRLQVDGLDCAWVSKVSPITVKQRVVADPIGELREYVREPGRLDFSHIRVTLPEAHAESWVEWHNDFLIRGNCSQGREKSGTLEFLGANLQDPLLRVQLSNLGVYRLGYERDAAGPQVRRVVVDLYCERMEIECAKSLGAAASESPGVATLDVGARAAVTWPPQRV